MICHPDLFRLRSPPVPGPGPSTALESLARLRTMRALVPSEDRPRFERLISEVEQAIWDTETVSADLARLIAIDLTEAPLRAAVPVELTDVVAAALRSVDALLSSRVIRVDVEAPPAAFAMGDRDRLEHLIAVALSIAASAARPRTAARLRYGPSSNATAYVELTPYSTTDPRVTIIEALARSQNIQLEAVDGALHMRLPAALGAASA